MTWALVFSIKSLVIVTRNTLNIWNTGENRRFLDIF